MKKTQFVELISLIKTTLVSFLSIVLFVGMGITLYAGITWTASVYEEHIDNAFNEGNANDLQIFSSLGLTDSDLEEVAQADGVSAVDPAYVSYQTIPSSDGEVQCAVYSTPDSVNTLTVEEGSLPTKPGEVALLGTSAEFSGYKVGDTVTFAADGKDSGANEGMKFLKQRSYTITALVGTTQYLCNYLASLGVNSDGQQLTCIMFATKDSFDADAFGNAYPMAYVACDSLRSVSTFDSAYKDRLAAITASVEQLGETLAQDRYQSVKDEAQAKVEKNQKKLDKAKAKLNDGDKKLLDAKDEISKKQGELDNAKSKLDSSTANYNSSKEQGKAKLTHAKQKIKRYTNKLAKAKKKYAEAKAKLEQSQQLASALNDTATSAQARYQAIQAGAATNDPQWVAQKCEENNQQVAADTAQINERFPDHSSKLDGLLAGLNLDASNLSSSLQSAYASSAGLAAAAKQIDEKSAAAQKKIDKLKAGIGKLKKGIASAKEKLASAQQRYDDKTASAQQQIDQGRADISSGESKLSSAQGKLSGKEKKLTTAREKYQDGKKKLAAAKRKVDKITPSNWVVNDRNYNSAVQMVDTTCQTLRSLRFTLASLFIVIGLLVCYSVMSRLVHERMKQLGTKKALGFKRSEISRQFLSYSLLACVLGILLGVVIGAPVVQTVLIPKMNQYVLQAPGPLLHPADVIGVGLLQIVLISASSWLACKSILRKNAVDLLAGHRPSAAKRHFYEGWSVWNRLGLLTKTMISNCLNDRRRMFGTFVGVAGCTALIVCAVTLQAGIHHTTNMQDETIERYDAVVYASGDTQDGTLSESTVDGVLSRYGIEPVMALRKQMGVNMPDGSQSFANVMVPQNNEDIGRAMTLELSQGSGDLSSDGALVSCAYGNHFGAKVGDMIKLTQSDGDEYEVPIAGFFDYYGGTHMVIMNAETYRKYLDDEPEYSARLIETKSVNAEELRQSLCAATDYVGFTDSRAVSNAISNSINSLAMTVVAIYISISALVALFVLLNLNVMFVAEKKRELIVMMINGYTLRDAKKYVSRDSIIMDSLGMIAGCVLGTVMGIMAIQSIENDVLAFIANPSIFGIVVGIVVCGAFSFIVMRIALRKVNKYRLTEAAD